MTRIIVLFLFLVTMAFSPSIAQEIEHAHSLHHSMIENKGQWNDKVLFQSKFDAGNLWIHQNQFIYHFQDFTATHESHAHKGGSIDALNKQCVLLCKFIGSNEVKEIEKSVSTVSYYNYFLGNDKSKWASNVKGFGEVLMKDFYNGIDMKLIENELDMKYEFHIKPKIDPNQIKWKYQGYDKISIDRKGNLKVRTALGEVSEEKPYAYQIINGKIVNVDCRFVLANNLVTFDLGDYNEEVELVIDPVLVFATFNGAISDNFGMTATFASDGSAFSGGMIYGNGFPTDSLVYDTLTTFLSSNFGVAKTITDVFISKYSSDGESMLWTTFIGGGDSLVGTETVHSLIADEQDNIYCYGVTSSTDFPIQGGFQTTHSGGVANMSITNNAVDFGTQGTDIFVAKFSASGQNLLGSTFIGGTANDGVNYSPTALPYATSASYSGLRTNYGDQFRGEIILDNAGNCIIASCTRSTDFPTQNPFQGSNNGGQEGVLFKLNSNLSSLLWSSYYGGSSDDACYSVKIDTNQNLVFTGGTSSNNLPNVNGWQTVYNGGSADGFVAKVSGNGQSFNGASYIGTNNYDQSFFVEVDRNNNVFLVGQSTGGFFPIINAMYSNPSSNQFILKLPYDLSAPLNSTIFGNGNTNFNLSPSAFLVDVCGNIYFSGWGGNILQGGIPMNSMPITPDAHDSTTTGFDFYLFVLDRNFDDIVYGTYFGGRLAREHVDGGTSRFDSKGVVYQSVCGGCGGITDSIATPNAFSTSNKSNNCNNLVFKFDFQLTPEASFTLSDTAICIGEPITLTNDSPSSDSFFWILPNGDTSTVFEPTLTFPSSGNYSVKLIIKDSICNLSDTSEIQISVEPEILLTVSNDTALCSVQNFEIWANSNGGADYFVWSSNINFTDTLNDFPMDSTIFVSSTGLATYYVKAGNDNCSSIDSVVVAIVDQSLDLIDQVTYCLGNPFPTVSVQNQTPQVIFTHTWTPTNIISGSNTGTSVLVDAPSSQYLYLQSVSSLGCIVNDSVLITVSSLSPSDIFITVSPNDTVPQGASVTLTGNPSGLSNYSWAPPEDVSAPNNRITTTQVFGEKEITLLVSDGICEVSTSKKLYIYELSCEEPFVFVPNAFSPNGDGENDILYVRSVVVSEVLFRVFNRWGEMVFETTDMSKGWDGTFRGKLMDPDVYDYYYRAICVDGQEKIKTGNVTLMR